MNVQASLCNWAVTQGPFKVAKYKCDVHECCGELKSLTFGSRTIIISCGSSFEHPCMRTVPGIRLCEPLYGNTDNLNLCAENTQLSLETCLF